MVPLRKIQLDATHQYTPTGSLTKANVGVPSAGVNLDPELFRRRRLPPPSMRGPLAAPPPVQRERAVATEGGPSSISNLEEAARAAQLRAISEPPPLRMVSGPGIVPGYMPDVLAMSGAQRQVFLPQNSTNDPYRDAAGNELKKKSDADDFEAFRVRSGGWARGR